MLHIKLYLHIMIIFDHIRLNTRKGGNSEALQLEGHPTSCKSFWAVFLAKSVLRMHRNCYLWASS